MCRAAAEEGIFCRGFKRWPEREFYDRWKGHLGVSTHLNREQMEALADLWQQSEQLLRRDALICDAQTVWPGACAGWNEFTDADLERFCFEILGENVLLCAEKDQRDQVKRNRRFRLTLTCPADVRFPSERILLRFPDPEGDRP
jgi:hypothetical protein